MYKLKKNIRFSLDPLEEKSFKNEKNIIKIGYKKTGALFAELLTYYLQVLLIMVNQSDLEIELVPLILFWIQLISIIYLDYFLTSVRIFLFQLLDFLSKLSVVLLIYFLLWLSKNDSSSSGSQIVFALILFGNGIFISLVLVVFFQRFLRKISFFDSIVLGKILRI